VQEKIEEGNFFASVIE